MNNRCYVDIHAIQAVPPSCINRDDTGSPKTARFGGVTRARVSSQSWKHTMRLDFKDRFTSELLGLRTKRIVAMVAEKIVDIAPETSAEAAEKSAATALELAGLKIKSVEKGTDALFFMSVGQAAALAALAVEGEKDKKKYSAALMEHPSVDMALFGRMVASDPSLNYDAAAQVANAISTHEVHNEFDYFTAVDDRSPEDNAGAGHVGTVEFNSATLYRYATVNALELQKSLGEQTAETIGKFVESFLRSMPTGKQNTYANRTAPDYVYVTIRTNQPINLSGAFEKPVVSEEGYVEQSVKRLENYAKKMQRKIVGEPANAFVVADHESDLGENVTMPELLAKLEATLKEVL